MLGRRRRGNGPSIYLVGTSGHPNYGDELITWIWASYYAMRFPRSDIWIDSPRPGQTSVLLARAGTRAICTDTLFHACWNAPSDEPEAVLDFGRRVIRQPGLIPREVTGVAALESADLIHIVGGGYINSHWPRHLALVSAAAESAEKSGAALAMTGAGLTPLSAEAWRPLTEVLAAFDVVDVRDEDSAAALTDLGRSVSLTTDDVFLSIDKVPRSPGWDAATALCLQNDHLLVDRATLLKYVAQTIRAWDRGDAPLVMIECLPPGDLFGWDELKAEFPQLELLPFDRLWREGFPSGTGMRWISTRFHPHLLGAFSGSQGLALALGGGYYDTKHQSLTRIGSPWPVVHDIANPAPDVPEHPDAVPANLASLRQRKHGVAEAITTAVQTSLQRQTRR